MTFLTQIPLSYVIPAVLTLGLAPFFPKRQATGEPLPWRAGPAVSALADRGLSA